MVTLPNNHKISVDLCGNIQISSNLILQDVLFVPQFQFNLISVSILTTDSQLNVNFFPDYFVIQDINTKMMSGKGDKHDALYVLQASDLNNSSPASSTFANTVLARIWHERLGHLSFQRFKFLNSQLHCNNNILIMIHAMFVHRLNNTDYLFLQIITCQNLLLI